jgi:hypothetical protein
MTLRNLLQVIVFTLLFSTAYSQVRQVNYRLKFNEQTDLFDCYLVIKEGNATSLKDRAQFNAQYTLLVPAGSRVSLVKNYMPIQNNQDYKGIRPLEWTVSNAVKRPVADPFNDYISIIPSLSPAAFYNDLKEGDEIKLFSVSIYPITDCGASVKIFEQGVDLHSGERGMEGGDFSNGFTMGGVQQKYAGNAPQVIPALNAVKNISKIETSGLSVKTDLFDAAQAVKLNFEWSGPNGFLAESKDLMIADLKAKHYGTYTLTVTDERGCKEEHSIEVKSPRSLLSEDKLSTPSINLVKNPESREKPETGINESSVRFDEIVRIYPNPAQNYFNILLEAAAGSVVKADLTDVNGRIIKNNIMNLIMTNELAETSVSVQDILPGIYNIIVRINDKESSHRLIVVK